MLLDNEYALPSSNCEHASVNGWARVLFVPMSRLLRASMDYGRVSRSVVTIGQDRYEPVAAILFEGKTASLQGTAGHIRLESVSIETTLSYRIA